MNGCPENLRPWLRPFSANLAGFARKIAWVFDAKKLDSKFKMLIRKVL
jgi:hypothetical protein